MPTYRRGNKMYGKRLIKKVGSLVIIAAIIASAFAIFPANRATVALATNVVINEIMYNPAGSDDYEWIEIYNLGTEEVNITGWVINGTIGGNTVLSGILDGNEYLIVAKNITAFQSRYPDITCPILQGNWTSLADTGGWVNLSNSIGELVDSVHYLGNYAENYSAERTVDNEWKQSLVEGGTPGALNSVWDIIPPVITEVKATPQQQKATKYVNITCNVTDNTAVTVVKVDISGPEGFHVNKTMNQGSYYYNASYNTTGLYTYYIWAEDMYGNTNKSAEFNFTIIPNFEVRPSSANYTETVTMEIYNATPGDTIELWKPGETERVAQRRADSEGRATFENILLDTVGNWIIKDVGQGWEIFFKVNPSPLTIEISPTHYIFEQKKSQTEGYNFDVTIKDKDGKYVEGAQIVTYWIDENGNNNVADQLIIDQTGANFTINVMGLPGVGIFNITASKNTTGDATPELGGYAWAKILPNTLIFSDVSTDEARQGFPSKKIFIVKYNDTNVSIDWSKPTNITIAFGEESNSTGDVDLTQGPVSITVMGEVFNISLTDTYKLAIEAKWPEKGTWTLRIKQNYEGNSMVDNETYEYVGETTFEVVAPPKVNVYVTPENISVRDLANNTWVLYVKIYGESIDEIGSPDAFNLTNWADITDIIKIEGDILYSPPPGAYEFNNSTGTWEIKVFPTKGNGKIYVNVTWPDKGEDGKVVNIVKGGDLTVSPTEVIVDNTYNISAIVKTAEGNAINLVDYLILYYEIPPYYESTVGWEKIKEKENEYNAQGEFVFTNITPDKAGVNIVAMAVFRAPDVQYAYACIASEAAHDLEVILSPDKVLVGSKQDYEINITKDNKSYDGNFYFYILNETALTKFHEGKNVEDVGINVTDLVARVSKGNYTLKNYIITEPGKYYLYVCTKDRKHDIETGKEPSFEVTKASVSVEPRLLVKNVDKEITLTFTVTWENEPVNGTLKAYGIMEVASYEAYVAGKNITIDIVNGKGNITNVTAVNVGNITFEFKPDGGEYAEAYGVLKVTTPAVTIEEPKEKVAFLGVENLITIVVTHPLTNEGCAGLDVEIITPTSGGNAIKVGETDENGKAIFGIIPLQTGKIKILVEGEAVGEIDVMIGLQIVVEKLVKGKEAVILVTTRGGKPVDGVLVKVDGAAIGTTDSNGEIKYTPEKEGTITITAEKEGYYSARKTIDVQSAPETPGFELLAIAIAMALAIFLVRRKHK